MSNKPPHMWGYWRDKYGFVCALEDCYADILAGDKDLQNAVFQIKNAERIIANIMAKRRN